MSNALGKKPVLLGRVVATQGIRGELRVKVYSGQSETILMLTYLMLGRPDGGMERFEIETAAVRGKKLVVSLKEYDNINQVLHLVGREIYATRDQLPELAEGEFYWCDLLGLKAVTEEGITLGSVTEIIATGSNDVYVVSDGIRELLIPAVEDVVLEIDLAGGKMVVSPPPGLMDL